jgi:hypothetical protein
MHRLLPKVVLHRMKRKKQELGDRFSSLRVDGFTD